MPGVPEYRAAGVPDIPDIVQFQMAMARETEGLQLDFDVCTAGVRAVFEHPERGLYYFGKINQLVVGAQESMEEFWMQRRERRRRRISWNSAVLLPDPSNDCRRRFFRTDRLISRRCRREATLRICGKTLLAMAGILNRTIEIGDQESSGMLLVSATQLTSLTIAVTFEDGSNLPSSSSMTVALLVSPGKPRGTSSSTGTPATDVTSIPMGRLRDGTFWTPFPIGVPYTLSIENFPEGYRIKSISGPGPTNAVSVPAADGRGTYIGVAPGAVSIMLQRTQ
jgi:hypothetical protein